MWEWLAACSGALQFMSGHLVSPDPTPVGLRAQNTLELEGKSAASQEFIRFIFRSIAAQDGPRTRPLALTAEIVTYRLQKRTDENGGEFSKTARRFSYFSSAILYFTERPATAAPRV